MKKLSKNNMDCSELTYIKAKTFKINATLNYDLYLYLTDHVKQQQITVSTKLVLF